MIFWFVSRLTFICPLVGLRCILVSAPSSHKLLRHTIAGRRARWRQHCDRHCRDREGLEDVHRSFLSQRLLRKLGPVPLHDEVALLLLPSRRITLSRTGHPKSPACTPRTRALNFGFST